MMKFSQISSISFSATGGIIEETRHTGVTASLHSGGRMTARNGDSSQFFQDRRIIVAGIDGVNATLEVNGASPPQ
jgi:hypothetical protein